MKSSWNGAALRGACVLVTLFWSAFVYGSPLVVPMDSFTVQGTLAPPFTDDFSNGLTPSQQPTVYNVFGAFPNGAQSGGLLTLNTDWGQWTVNAPQLPRQTLGVQYLPFLHSGALESGDTIRVTGIFNIVTPPGPVFTGYGIQLQNIIPFQGQTQVLELDVQYNPNYGADVIRFLLQDFQANKITTLGYVLFDPLQGADQIWLDISNVGGSTPNDFIARYAFGFGGNFGLVLNTIPGGSGDLFIPTDSLRGRFIDYTSVPEPATIALFGIGLAGLGFSRRRKRA